VPASSTTLSRVPIRSIRTATWTFRGCSSSARPIRRHPARGTSRNRSLPRTARMPPRRPPESSGTMVRDGSEVYVDRSDLVRSVGGVVTALQWADRRARNLRVAVGPAVGDGSRIARRCVVRSRSRVGSRIDAGFGASRVGRIRAFVRTCSGRTAACARVVDCRAACRAPVARRGIVVTTARCRACTREHHRQQYPKVDAARRAPRAPAALGHGRRERPLGGCLAAKRRRGASDGTCHLAIPQLFTATVVEHSCPPGPRQVHDRGHR